MKRKQKQKKLEALKDWMQRKREENSNMTVEERTIEAREHKLERENREEKRRKIKWNKRKRFLLWKRRHRKKLRGNVKEKNDKK